jgi:hypothetical protein
LLLLLLLLLLMLTLLLFLLQQQLLLLMLVVSLAMLTTLALPFRCFLVSVWKFRQHCFGQIFGFVLAVVLHTNFKIIRDVLDLLALRTVVGVRWRFKSMASQPLAMPESIRHLHRHDQPVRPRPPPSSKWHHHRHHQQQLLQQQQQQQQPVLGPPTATRTLCSLSMFSLRTTKQRRRRGPLVEAASKLERTFASDDCGVSSKRADASSLCAFSKSKSLSWSW